MLILTNRQEIDNAQHELESRLEMQCDKQVQVKLGYKGGHNDSSVSWFQAYDLWFSAKKIEGSRYWNAFGLSKTAPIQNSMLSIVCEINPPVEGLNKRVQGAFVRNTNGNILLVHRGRIGGGKPGIGRELFFDNYQGEVREISGNRFAIIGEINSPDFVEYVTSFVQEVKRIKNLVN